MLHVDIYKLHANKILLHVDITYFACRGRSIPPEDKLSERKSKFMDP